ncbi:MAG: glutamate--cysteine ligase [Pseudanabaenaceae cyanobacterium bins.68]|nr:glutamate--cysteine ligase [Pseudanabaenaceae cyanobacterium bins.68]
MLLTKGFEIEVYTGTPQGEVVGFSDQIVADLDGFVREPDSRNVEYTTAPYLRYEQLLLALVEPRVRLRRYLKNLGDYTLMPGSTLALGGSDRFFRSDPQNPYHTYIEQTYGTKVVTASVHINLGISDPEQLLRACRLIRLEAPLYLALSAASPFLDGQITGSHSTRWQMFPKTPSQVPLFLSHQHYIDWTGEQLKLGTMQNVRHLWASVRPNGDRRPYSLNRLELRICDLVYDPVALLAITALLELRLLDLLASDFDPTAPSISVFSAAELVEITDQNEILAAQHSLEAALTHWQTGNQILAKDWIAEHLEMLKPKAKHNGSLCFLLPLQQILDQGNEAQQWLKACDQGNSPTQVFTSAIATTTANENQLAADLGLC